MALNLGLPAQQQPIADPTGRVTVPWWRFFTGFVNAAGQLVVPIVLAAGKIFIGDSSGIAQQKTVSGDATLANTGVLTLSTVNANVGTFQGLTVNAKGLVTAASNQNYLTGNQTITLSGDVTGSGTTAITTTLATVNGNVGQFSVVTVNAKGLATAATNLALTGDVTGTASGASLATTVGAISGQSVTPASWTPADGSGASLSFTGVSANYTRLGNLVFAYAQLTYPATADASAAKLSGLPFTVANANYADVPCVVTPSVTITGGLVLEAIKATTTASFDVGSPFGAVTNAQLSGATLNFMLIYPVA